MALLTKVTKSIAQVSSQESGDDLATLLYSRVGRDVSNLVLSYLVTPLKQVHYHRFPQHTWFIKGDMLYQRAERTSLYSQTLWHEIFSLQTGQTSSRALKLVATYFCFPSHDFLACYYHLPEEGLDLISNGPVQCNKILHVSFADRDSGCRLLRVLRDHDLSNPVLFSFPVGIRYFQLGSQIHTFVVLDHQGWLWRCCSSYWCGSLEERVNNIKQERWVQLPKARDATQLSFFVTADECWIWMNDELWFVSL